MLFQTQIEKHVDLRYCTGKKPLIFEYGKKDSRMSPENAIHLCRIEKTHSPMVFLDKAGTRKLPPADFLAMFQVVITTSRRFMNEWKNGSFQEELERANIGDNLPTFMSADFSSADHYYTSSEDACPLLKVHWLRMVVDEGHSMGKNKDNCTIKFASWISAERRWAMTGTPTRQNATQIGQLKGLMSFLQHDFFTPRRSGDQVWRNYIARVWREGRIASFFRLKSLLQLLMKRHTKLDIAELPPPHFTTETLPMSFTEVTTYNTLVSGVQSNIYLTSLEGKTSGKQDSLLNRSQIKFAREALANIRRVCIGWSRVVPSIRDDHFIETIDLLREHGLPEQKVVELRRFLDRACTENLTQCSCCTLRLSTLLLLPCCGEHICTECMDSSKASCPLCDTTFDIDDFQRLQPGFVLQWKSNLDLKNSKETIPPIGNPIDPVVNDIATTGAEGHGDGEDSRPIIRPPQQRRRTRKFGDGHKCEYDRFACDGRCIHCLTEHEACKLINKHSRCEICYRVAQECPEEESKSFYLVTKLLQLYRMQNTALSFEPTVASPLGYGKKRPLKAIVFSQFRKALNVVGDRLLKRFGTLCVAEYFGKYRTQELHKFSYEPDCFCMLLGKDGSEGLDLSFVTHIFFLDVALDKGLVDQAVARAWRMGSLGRVEVETLVAKNTVEETMQKTDLGLCIPTSDESSRFPQRLGSKNEEQRAKTHFLLRSLRLMTDYHSFGQNNDKPSKFGSVSATCIHIQEAKPMVKQTGNNTGSGNNSTVINSKKRKQPTASTTTQTVPQLNINCNASSGEGDTDRKFHNSLFIPSSHWKGAKPGYYFGTTSERGTGYYWDKHHHHQHQQPQRQKNQQQQKRQRTVQIAEERNETHTIEAK